MSVWWTSYTGHLKTIGTRVEQGICYELDQTDKETNPMGLSIYTQGKHGYALWLCYKSIPNNRIIIISMFVEPLLVARWGERFNTQSMFSGNADCISATQFYMSALIVMSVINAELVFPVCGNICSHFLIYWINPEYIWFHPPCTVRTIVLNWNLSQTLLSFNCSAVCCLSQKSNSTRRVSQIVIPSYMWRVCHCVVYAFTGFMVLAPT